jgi:hypothetical protein
MVVDWGRNVDACIGECVAPVGRRIVGDFFIGGLAFWSVYLRMRMLFGVFT